MRDNQQLNFSGALNQDTSVEYIQNDYVDAKNVRHLTTNTESTQAQIPVLGNSLAFDLGSVSAQNKTWRILTPLDAVNIKGGIFLYDQSGNLFPTISGQAQPMEWNRNQSVANQATDIATLFAGIDGNGNTIINVVDNYIEITPVFEDTLFGYDIGFNATTTTGATPTTLNTSLDPTILQEAYDITLGGELRVIGSYDLEGDLFVWSTPQVNLPTTITAIIDGVTLVSAPVPANFQYQVSTDIPHGLTTGMKVVIANVSYTGTPLKSPNGIWLIAVINSTTFNLREWYNPDPGAVFVWTNTTLGTITLYTEAVGEIGVAQKNENLPLPVQNQWTNTGLDNGKYTRLLRTKEWGFRTKKQADTYCERTSIKDSIYWTDDFNVPRVFYYSRPLNGIFINKLYDTGDLTGDLDGAIEIINPNGKYEYGSIGEETKLILSSTDAHIIFTSQTQAGGQIASGNWRYTIRFLSDSLSPTEWTDLTNPINVYSANRNGSPQLIIGDEPHTTTPKINNLLVSGVIPGLFKYIELAGINYVGGAIEGFVIKRVLLDSASTSLIISHTGTETDVVNLDLGTLSQFSTPVVTAKNINAIDNRMILSNITVAAQNDFTAWAQTFKHYLFQKSIDSCGAATLGTLKMAEYQDPDNVYNNMGYMQNETYRFGVKVRFKKNGYVSDAFFVDDVIFDTNPMNSASTDPARRLFGLPNFNLTDFIGASPTTSDTTTVYVPAINFSNIDLDFMVDGVKVRDLIDTFYIVRAEVTNPTIIASGYAIPSIEAVNIDSPNYGFTYNGNVTYFPVFPNGASNGIGEYPFISGKALAPTNPVYDPPVAGNGFGYDKQIAAFYSPDIQFGHTAISFLSGDEIINHGNAMYPNFTAMSGGGNVSSQYGQWTGFFNTTGVGITTSHPVSSGVVINKGGSAVLATSGKTYNKFGALFSNNSVYSICDINTSLVLETTTPLTVFGTQTDYGFYYCQYYRPVTDQYGDANTTKYVTCGHSFDVDSSVIGLQTTDVFGGDTFTQLNYFRHRFYSVGGDTFAGTGFLPWTTAVTGFGGGLSFYCQNRINAQMKQKSASQTGNLYPAISTLSWIETLTDTDGTQGEAYQEGYTIRNQVQSSIAFDSAIETITDMPTRVIWSELKPQNSTADQFRIYLPLNFKDLDLSFGEIVHHANGNGELVTWQSRKFQRQFFNTRGTLETSVTEVVIGDGSVMSRDGVTLSTLGSKHKWAIIKGKSTGGNDVFYWINTELKKAIRFGYDGTVSIGDIKGMQSFFANNLVWVDDKDTPADGQGICGVWNDRYAEIIWTMRGVRDFTPWSVAVPYPIGEYVSFIPTTFSTFEQTGEIFVSKAGFNVGNEPVAVYPVGNTILTITGTTLLTITTTDPHLLLTNDEVVFSGIAGLSVDINGVAHTVTVTGAFTFEITVALLVNTYVGGSGIIAETISFYWELISHTNNNYYNEYSIVFSEFKNKFVYFLTPKPKIYLKWTDSYLTPRPVSIESRVYENDKDSYLIWYDDTTTKQQEEGDITGVINKGYPETKWYEAIGVDSDIVPKRFEFATKTQESYLNDTEFETREDSHFSPLKEDSTITATNPLGLNDSNTSLLFGKWVKVKMFFEIGVYQKLLDFNIKFRVSPRTKNK